MGSIAAYIIVCMVAFICSASGFANELQYDRSGSCNVCDKHTFIVCDIYIVTV